MNANDHTTCASFYRDRGFKRVRELIRLKRELDANEWFMHPDGIEGLKDEVVFQYQLAISDFRQAARDEAAAMQRREMTYDTREWEPAELAEFFDYLDALRESGVTNMFGAGPYLEAAFEMEREDSTPVVRMWMKTFGSENTMERAVRAVAEAQP